RWRGLGISIQLPFESKCQALQWPSSLGYSSPPGGNRKQRTGAGNKYKWQIVSLIREIKRNWGMRLCVCLCVSLCVCVCVGGCVCVCVCVWWWGGGIGVTE